MIYLICTSRMRENNVREYLWHETFGGTLYALKKHLRELQTVNNKWEFKVFRFAPDGTKILVKI